ncbi:MAG: negative modulator of initiation of replication [Congregibacter sp.]|jgi:negative modulator of initiation of replication
MNLMKSIQIEDDLYHFIASQTQDIGESASDILRRLVMPQSLTITRQDTSVVADIPNHSSNENSINPTDSSEQVFQASDVFSELEGHQLQAIPKMVERWLLVLSVIHKHNSHKFSKVLGMSGRNRTYFATDKDTLLATGSSINPKNVPGSDYWVITNNNTVKKINMLKEVAEQVGFNSTEIEQLITIFAPEHIK